MASPERSLLSENKPASGSTRIESNQTLHVMNGKIAVGAWALNKTGLCRHRWAGASYHAYILTLTFICYMCYHMSRKPFSVVKSVLAPNCSQKTGNCSQSSEFELQNYFYDSNNADTNGWAPFNGDHCQTLLGSVDYSWLFSYAIAMFFSGFIGDRMDLRYFLTIGMVGSGVGVGLLGVAYYAHIHHIYYFILVQVFGGAMQSTGWPGVVAVMGNWFGKQNRGLVMGIWNAHTSVGNILGTLIPSFWAEPGKNWSWSFFVPGFIMIGTGIIVFLFLVSDPTHVGLSPPLHHLEQSARRSTSPNTRYGATSPCPEDPSIGTDAVEQSLLSDDDKLSLLHEDDKQLSCSAETTPPTRRQAIVNVKSHRRSNSDPQKAIGFFGALLIPGVIEYSLALFFSKLVAYTFLFWLPFYVANNAIGGKCLPDKQSDWLSTLFDVGGIVGGIINGFLSDLLRARAITCASLLYLSVPALFCYRTFGKVNLGLSIVLLMVCGATVNGPYAVITTAVSSDLGTDKAIQGNQRAKATVSAIIDGTGSIGAAIGPLLTGLISDHFGWNNVFYVLMGSCLLSALFLSRLVLSDFREWWMILKRRIWLSNQ